MRKRKGREMWKRKPRPPKPKTLNPQQEEAEDGNKKIEGKSEKGFFACYLLTSLNPRSKGHTYIGFTVNPRRRIRQHNGEIGSGATRTKRRRPWEMLVCIFGFPTNVSALQFEWAWQHPTESVAVRQAAATFKSFSGITNKIKLAYTMLNLPAWQSLNITVNYFSTKYTKHSAGCPGLPIHMKVQVCPMDELPCYIKGDETLFADEDGWNDDEECDEARDTGGTVQETYTDSSLHISADYLSSIDKIFSKDNEISNVSGAAQETYTDSTPHISADYLRSIDKMFSKDDEASNASGTIQETYTDSTPHVSPHYLHSIDKIFCEDAEASNASDTVHDAVQETCTAARDSSIPAADFSHSIGCFEGYEMRQLRDSSTPGVDDRRPLGFFKSLVKTASSIATSFSAGECAEDGDMLGSTKENAIELEWSTGKHFTYAVAATKDQQPWPRRKQFTTTVASDKDQQPIHSSTVSHKAEVIDLLSPSPDCRIRSCSKKRRISSICPVIIDLT